MGLVLGVRHALEPDHLAAVGTFVPTNATPRRAATIGALWGAGHAVAILALGAVVLGLRGSIPSWLDTALELFVGAMLIGLGVRAIKAGWLSQDVPTSAELGSGSRWRPFLVGLAHGAAGTGAVVVLASTAMGGVWSGLLFLGVFGVGSAAAMAAVAGMLGVPVRRVATVARYRAWLLMGAGCASVLVGIWWSFEAIR